MGSKFFITIGIVLVVAGLMLNYVRMQSSFVIQPPPASSVSVSNPQISCSSTPTVSETEGPYYKGGSPERTNLYDKNIPGTKFTLTGYVLDTNCNPKAHAWLDFWQADGNGHYDNSGYTLRGHQYTDAQGKFTLVTVIPGEYPGRTPHIHVKVRANSNSPILTTQLYIPGLTSNAQDSIYDPTLQMQKVNVSKDGTTATFTFIIKK
ncbi:MAG TPA: hypothetical protein VND99_01675 [Candidatus Acidoferrales bacterium]|nr:hypothetical protein [Candidatus Acidoferrales bacterium]